MNSPQTLHHLGGSKIHSDFRSISSQMETSKDVQQLTFTYFTEEDISAPYGPYCRDCMNQLFRDGELNAVSMVFIFRTLGFIPFPTRALVFLNGTNDPFSMKDIAEDFLVMSCSNCTRNNSKLNTIPAADNDRLNHIHTSSGRKRKLPNSPSRDKLPSEQQQEMDSSPSSKKKVENAQMLDNQVINIPSTSFATGDEVWASRWKLAWAKANCSSSQINNELLVNAVAQTKERTIVGKSTTGTGKTVDGILGALMIKSQIDKLPTLHNASPNNNEETVGNANKESTSNCSTSKEVQSSEGVDILPANCHVAKTDEPSRLPHGTADFHAVMEPSKLPVSSTGPSQPKSIESFSPEISTSARLQTGLGESSLFVKNKDVGQESSETQHLAKNKLPAISPPVDIQDVRQSNSAVETLKNIYETHNLAREHLLDYRTVADARESLSKGVYNPHIMAPFLEGTMNEVPRISFHEVIDTLHFLTNCGINDHRKGFGMFMCQIFPEIAELERCAYCGISFHPVPFGLTYLSHFLSYDHIIKLMSNGCSFRRDLLSLKKCLLDFLTRNEYKGYIKRLSGPLLDVCIKTRQFSQLKKFKSLENRLNASTNNNEKSVRNVNKESTSSGDSIVKVQFSDKKEIFPVSCQVETTDGPGMLPRGTVDLHNVPEASKLPVSTDGSAQHKPFEGCVPEISTSARLQTGLVKSASSVGNKDVGQESRETQQLAQNKLPANPPLVDRQETRLSKSAAETLKNIYETDNLAREHLLDYRTVAEARESVSKGVYNPYLMVPFLEGTIYEIPRMSFQELYDGMHFLKVCGMDQYSQDFGIFMCQYFPEIAEIELCAYCGISFPPDPSGQTYISHFLSFNHIIKSMNKGWSFARDFVSLKKCLLDFATRNKLLGHVKRLSGTQLDDCIRSREFSKYSKSFNPGQDV